MASTTLDGVLLKGVAASRPAANAVAKGTIYSATDTGAITQSDGASTWSTYATINAAGMTNPMTTKGDVILGDTGGTPTRLAAGTSGYVLTSAGAAAFPTWSAAAGGTFVGVRVYRSTSQSINSGAATSITFDSESYDSDGFHDNVTNNSRLTVPSGKAGKYHISGVVEWANNVTGDRISQLLLNGTTLIGWVRFPAAAGSGTGSGEFSVPVMTDYALSVGDYVELQGYQSTGGALNAFARGVATPTLSMYLIGA